MVANKRLALQYLHMPKEKVQFSFGKTPVMLAPEQGGDVLNMYVFGEIGNWWGLNKNDVLLSLKGKKYKQINLVISSNGGDLSDALVIRDLLKAYPANVTSYLTGVCASAATILADAGNTVVMSKQCIYMIHKPLFQWTGGNSDELRKDAEILDMWEELALNVYEDKTKMSREEISELMRDTTFMTADIAKSYGFVDDVVEMLDIDFDIDTTGTETEREYFIKEEIYFNNAKTVYNQAIANALKGGYRQLIPENNGENLKTEKKAEMNQIAKLFVSMLVKAGFITTENEQAALNAANELETPEMIATIVREEVSKQVKNFAPSMKATDVVKLIEIATDEEKAKIAELLGVMSFDDTDLKTQMQDLSGKVATLIVGEGGGSESNGEDGLSGTKEKKTEPSYKEREHAKMYLQAFESGSIDAKMYKELTGQDAPKRERVRQN